MSRTQENLSLEIETARWEWLKPHNEREALFAVSPDLDLAHVGERVAADDAVTVERWLASHLLARPTAAQVAEWDKNPATGFSMLIVSPFVLIQEKE
ncbi:hypothetical protein OR1_03223 [Geobacter sp. OR-1]|uniref:DUF2288 domain-containing protein n=1 Tax=Geobacter sp. OR-1 TaxID=1266765 RepID=UPI0005430742|nr:DUF2288 domain-containing protein [Geobacter sp. OR-1]GAM10923.1 hypothetical protein OR1_03223 [Geobacter sp. OR-1]